MSSRASQAADHAAAAGSEALARALLDLDLRPLRYFRDLLALGLSGALRPRSQVETLRGERIALGIDIPELDTVPLWAWRRSDGAISIPFLARILDEVLTRTEEAFELCWAANANGDGLRGVARDIAKLRHDCEQADRSSSCEPTAPTAERSPGSQQLLPYEDVVRICGPGGALSRLVEELQLVRAEALAASIRSSSRAGAALLPVDTRQDARGARRAS